MYREKNLKYSTLKEILVVFPNGSNCVNHFIITKLAQEFEGEFSHLVENTEKYLILFSCNKRIGKKGKEIKPKIISYKLKFIDSSKFMTSSLSNLVDNVAEKIYKIKRPKLNVNIDMMELPKNI